MDKKEYESVLLLLATMKVKVQTALDTINNCSTSSEPVNSPPSPNSVTVSVPKNKEKMDKQPVIPKEAVLPKPIEQKETKGQSIDSRDAVKAQREAKKAAKAAKKIQSKEKDKSGNQIPPVQAKVIGSSSSEGVESIKPKQDVSKANKSNVTIGKEKLSVDVSVPLKLLNVEKQSEVSGDTGDSSQVSTDGKSKAQLRAERRALQEAQRAMKTSGVKENKPKESSGTPTVAKNITVARKEEKPAASSNTVKTSKTIGNAQTQIKTVSSTATSSARTKAAPRRLLSESKVQTLFDHLPQSHDPEILFEDSETAQYNLDCAFVTLGQKYANGIFISSKERCIAFLHTLKDFIERYRTPVGKDFKYAVAQTLKPNLDFLQKCRPFAVAMENAVEHFNNLLRGLQSEIEREIKQELCEELDRFIEERINTAKEAIVLKGKEKIKDGDVVLIFGYPELVWAIINEAAQKTSFSIVIVRDMSVVNDISTMMWCIDSFLEKRRASGDEKISVDYIGITGLSNRIQTVTKVFLDAEGLLTNGKVLARAGTSEIALIASEHNIPVLVCCETYKFCDKSPTDSFSLNELSNCGSKLMKGEVQAYEGYLKTPELVYDVTPSELVTAVITDVDILPSTSVPVVLRVQENRSRNI